MAEIEAFLAAGIFIAKKAGKFLKKNFAAPHRVSFKGAVDLVTEVDIASEKLITRFLKKRFPSHSLLGEEGTDTQGSKNSDYLWIFDPLDGTTNYAHSFPWFSVSLALQHKKQTLLGVVYHPMLAELFWAVKGRGAFLGGSRLQVSGQKALSKSLLATGFPYDLREKPEPLLKKFSLLATSAQGVRRAGSAALDLAYLAAGRFDGFWEEGLHPWDVAAGILMIEESGGKVSDFAGQPYRLGQRELLASNGKIHPAMLKVLKLKE